MQREKLPSFFVPHIWKPSSNRYSYHHEIQGHTPGNTGPDPAYGMKGCSWDGSGEINETNVRVGTHRLVSC